LSGGAPLPIGVIGVGSLGFHHARILREVPGARMMGVYDSDADRREQVATELGVKAYPSIDAMLKDVEAAVIAVPTTFHAEVALQALERGVHLLIEKPIAASIEEAERILTAASASGAMVATGHVERFNAALRACERYLDEPRFIESHRLAPFGPRGTDVAVVLDLMIHDIDLVLGLAKRPVAHLDAVGVPVLTPSVDIANARIRFDSGAVANITASRVSRERMRKIRVFQRSGYLSMDLGAGTGEFLRLRKGVELGALATAGALDASGAGGKAGIAALEGLVERVELQGDGKEPLRAELESFVAAIRGEGEMVVSGEDGRRALEVALEIVRTIETHVLDPSSA
jgi:predicted dehydrogenase